MMIKTTHMVNAKSISIVIFTDEHPTAEHSPPPLKSQCALRMLLAFRGHWPPGSISIIHQPELVLRSGWLFYANNCSSPSDFTGMSGRSGIRPGLSLCGRYLVAKRKASGSPSHAPVIGQAVYYWLGSYFHQPEL
jgi:hypothetical protein